MPVQITVTPNLRGLEQTAKKARDLRPLLKTWGQIARTSIVRNFEVGGRPAWKPSIRVQKKGGKTLILSGALLQSIAAADPKVTDTSVAIGTNRVYAAIHQFGGVIETGPRSSVLAFKQDKKTGKLLGFMSRKQASRRKAGSIQIRFAHSGGAYIPIPARPFLLLQTEDIAEMRLTALDYLTGR